MSGTEDFAYSAIHGVIEAMIEDGGGMFTQATSLANGNVSFRERKGYQHNGDAANEYTYNGLRLFFNGPRLAGSGTAGASSGTERVWYTTDTAVDDVRNDTAFGDWGRLIFPVDEGYMTGSTLGSINLT